MLTPALLSNFAKTLPRTVARFTTLSTAALICAALSGCAPVLPAATELRLTLPPAYPAQPAADAASVPHINDWHEHFTDPALRRLVQQALEHNHDLRSAVLRVAEVRAAYGIQRADRLPTVAAILNGTRTAVPGDLNVSGRRVIGGQLQAGVGFASWEIDFWGRVSSLNEAALQTYLASDAARRAATVSLIAQVANAYLALRETEERLALAQGTLNSRAESLRIFQRRTELGATSKLDLTQVELLWQQAKTLVAQLEQAQATQRHALDLLLGAPADLATSTQGLDSLVIAPELAAGLPSDLLMRRPDIIAAEHALAAASASVKAARAAFFPNISLTASGGSASAELDHLFHGGSKAWSFTPSLTLPIFDLGRRQAAFDLASVRRELSVARYEQAIQAAFRDVSDALSAQRWLAEQVGTLRATLRLQNERSRLAKLRYDSGAVRYLEVLDAERERLAAEQQLVQTRRAQLATQVALYAALGGGAGQNNASNIGKQFK